MRKLTTKQRMEAAKDAAQRLAKITGYLVGRPLITRRDGFPTTFLYPLVDRLGRRVGETN